MVAKNKHKNDFTEKELNLAEIGKLLGHPARLRVLQTLLEQELLTSSEIAARVPLARMTVLQHIAALKEGNWLTTTSDGSNIQYQINSPVFDSIRADVTNLFRNLSEARHGLQKNSVENSEGTRILFLCTGNSCRSQMAEGFINAYGKKYNITACSAGTRPAKEVQPTAVEVMAEKNIDISGHYPKTAKEYIGDRSIDLVIIVCDQAEKECPYLFPYSRHKIFMPFPDPKTPEEFREVRDQIETKLRRLLEELAAE